jgi:predicted ester cyclase
MSLDKNKAIIRRLFEAEFKKDLASLDELMASDYVDNALQLRSREEYKQMHTLVDNAFPDYQQTIEDITAEGNKVWVRFKGTGTHTGEYRGLAPTGKKITETGVLTYCILNGKIVEKESGVYDELDFYKQLGVIEYKGFPDEVK